MKQITRLLDSIIYMIIGPFGVLYVFPQFFLTLESYVLDPLPVPTVIIHISRILIYGGAALAIWCAVIMRTTQRGSPIAFVRPTGLVRRGPYKIVRHPMMWSLFIILGGEVLRFASPFLFIWLLIWIRFSIIYIEKYEEPYLISVFKEELLEYCRVTPRWLPSRNHESQSSQVLSGK